LNIYVIFYERLVQDFDTELKLLLKYLEVELNQGERERVKELVSFKRMHSRKPDHVRMGRSGNWVDILNDSQKERVERIAGSLLNILGYPPSNKGLSGSLPALPTKIRPQQLDEYVQQAKRMYRTYNVEGAQAQSTSSITSLLKKFLS
jgi:hypothetical protein